jgi:predicted dehydrogenase
VIITAATSSTDPVEFAGVVARKKGKVVIVGAVPTGFSREHYYRKELELRMSCSYGPGRYDANYEEKGMDYPIGWVRWTENRNMSSFLDLLEGKKLDIESLISHEFSLAEAVKAYDMILAKSEPFAGILVKYEVETPIVAEPIPVVKAIQPSQPQVGFIGAGNFAQNMLLPRLKGICQFTAIAAAQGFQSRDVADKYGFLSCYADADELLQDVRVNTVFVVTRHHTHGEFVKKALAAGKHVFVEKPLAMNLGELEEIRQLYDSLSQDLKLMVGFNRRFASAIQKAYNLFVPEQKKAILIRVNAGQISADHWTNDPAIGGGRIIGEACHFIDLAMFLAGSRILSVSAEAVADGSGLRDTMVIDMAFANGSVASVSYVTQGNKNLAKEYLEIHGNGISVVVQDFREIAVYGKTVRRERFREQDKGHREELSRFIKSVKDGSLCPIPFAESYLSMKATLMCLESLRSGRKILLDEELGTTS